MAYINQKGILNDWIRKSLSIYFNKDVLINPGIIRHIEIINNSAQTSARYGFSRISFPFGLLIHKQTLLSCLDSIFSSIFKKS